jgi:hypothetical protein
MRDVRELMLQWRREEKRKRRRRDYAMMECVVRTMGRWGLWDDGDASGSEGMRIGAVFGEGVVGWIA